MYLRELKGKDAERMLEWMHDENVVENLSANFKHMTINDCEEFIAKANLNETKDLHRAICVDDDRYVGTISLKNISYVDSNAEYAIALRTDAMGCGISSYATKEILRIAFKELGLHKVYLYVKETNIRARKFYKKIGFREEGCFLEHIKAKEGNYDTIYWFAMLEREFNEMEKEK